MHHEMDGHWTERRAGGREGGREGGRAGGWERGGRVGGRGGGRDGEMEKNQKGATTLMEVVVRSSHKIWLFLIRS